MTPFCCEQTQGLRLWAVLDPTRTAFLMILEITHIWGQCVSKVLPIRHDNFNTENRQVMVALPNFISKSMVRLFPRLSILFSESHFDPLDYLFQCFPQVHLFSDRLGLDNFSRFFLHRYSIDWFSIKIGEPIRITHEALLL